MDSYLLEAMREVDAMLPDSPPIAPRPLTPAQLAYYEGMQNAADKVDLTTLVRATDARRLLGRPEPTSKP